MLQLQNLNEVPSRLYIIRTRYLKKTQKEICTALNFSQSLLSFIESGKYYGKALFCLVYFYINQYGVNSNWIFSEDNKCYNVFLKDDVINFF